MDKVIVIFFAFFLIQCVSAQFSTLGKHWRQYEMNWYSQPIQDEETNEALTMHLASSAHRELAYNALKHGVQKIVIETTANHGSKADLPISLTCLQDLAVLFQGLTSGELWAIKIFDAIGKVGNGITRGNIFWYGVIDECFRVTEDTGAPYDANYCLSFVGRILLGICAPETCTGSDMDTVLNYGLSALNDAVDILSINITRDTACFQQKTPLKAGDYIAIIWIIGLVSFLVAATLPCSAKRNKHEDKLAIKAKGDTCKQNILEETDDSAFISQRIANNQHGIAETTGKLPELADDNYRKPPSKESGEVLEDDGPLLEAFSLKINGMDLIDTSHKFDEFSSLNGIRCISAVWILLIHTNLYYITSVDNLVTIFQKLGNIPYQIIANGDVAADTFLLVSGFLITYRTINQLGILGRVNDMRFWITFYIRRYFRLTPLYGFIILVACTLLIRLCEGPIYALPEMNLDMCKRNWWTNLLYINNYYPTEDKEKCLTWSWYLAVLMQCYIISPLFIILLYKHKKLGIVAIVTVAAASLLTTGLLSKKYGLPVTAIGRPTKNTTNTEIDYIYAKTYTRMSPFLVGILLGYLMTLHSVRHVKLHTVVSVMGWLSAGAVMLTVLFGISNYYDNVLMTDANEAVMALYNACHRFAWAIGVAWVIFACETGHGGIAYALLSWGVWKPIGKMTYCLFILHPAMILIYYTTRSTTQHYDDFPMIYTFAALILFLLPLCAFLYVALELPIVRLTKNMSQKVC